ncbi:MAG: YggT family protein [Comamonadaceae bacterium]|nr:MAG: YggT family protein [Comamonadaceae bacterium]
MLYQIFAFLLDVVIGLLGGACLLRMYMQYQRVPFSNPLGRAVMALTDWLVLPLRKIIPAAGRVDVASLVGAFLLELAQYAVLWFLSGMGLTLLMLPVMALFGLARLVLSALTGLMIVYAVLSWVQGGSPIYQVIDRLAEPLLRPLRRVIPLVGGVDLSPLAFLVLVQVAGIILGHLQGAIFRIF